MDFIKTNTCWDDYVERGAALEELTVTITLCEYRQLIHDTTENEYRIRTLEEENKKLTDNVKNLSEILVLKCPDVVEKIKSAAAAFIHYDIEGEDGCSCEME